jgi:hypothetical protein
MHLQGRIVATHRGRAVIVGRNGSYPWQLIAEPLRDDGTVDDQRLVLVDTRKAVFVETEDGMRGVLPMGVGA